MFDAKDKTLDKDSLQTPPGIFKWLDSVYDFNVDLCASEKHYLCKKYYTEDASCLDNHWFHWKNQVAFCNPPYSNIDPFLKMAIAVKHLATTVFLIPDFNGEERFQVISENATTIIHLIGRVSFIRPDNGERYTGNNRGSVIVEFSQNYWNNPPVHRYERTKDILQSWN